VRQGFLTKIAYTNFLWGSGLVLLLAAAILNFFFPAENTLMVLSETQRVLNEISVFGVSVAHPLANSWLSHLFQFFLFLGVGLIMQNIATEFRLIRVRSYFPFFLCCSLFSSILPKCPLNEASLVSLFFSLSCLRLFSAQEKEQKSRAIFDATVLLFIASIFQSRLLYLLPAFWIVMAILQVFDFRTFLASVLGVLSIAWIVGGISFLMGDYSFPEAYARDLTDFRLIDFSVLPKPDIAYSVFLAMLMISALLSFWPRQNLEKLRTRNYLNSVLLIWFSLMFLWIFSANNMGYLMPLLSLSALVIAHFFSLVDTLFSRLLFVVLMILSVTVYLLF
jgi:hypothetical protein